MEIRLGYELGFEVPRPTPMQLMLYVHPEQASRLRQAERIEIEPATAVEDFVDEFGNRAARILAPAGTVRIRDDNVNGGSGRAEPPSTPRLLRPRGPPPPPPGRPPVSPPPAARRGARPGWLSGGGPRPPGPAPATPPPPATTSRGSAACSWRAAVTPWTSR